MLKNIQRVGPVSFDWLVLICVVKKFKLALVQTQRSSRPPTQFYLVITMIFSLSSRTLLIRVATCKPSGQHHQQRLGTGRDCLCLRFLIGECLACSTMHGRTPSRNRCTPPTHAPGLSRTYCLFPSLFFQLLQHGASPPCDDTCLEIIPANLPVHRSSKMLY